MSYIREYMTYVAKDEANENYHRWSCLVTIAAFLGRKVWVQRPYQRIYANIYAMLVGPQGNRKTAAKSIAQDIMREVGGIPFACEATTREYLIELMKKSEEAFTFKEKTDTFAPLTICVTEFKEFVAKDPVGIITFLTAIYDQDFYDYGTMKRGQDVIYNPYLNMLACETPEWLTGRLKESVVTGGFSRRLIYLYETEHYNYIVDELPLEQTTARVNLIKEARRIKEITGEYKFAPDAKAWYDKWYLRKEKPLDPGLIGFYESKHTLLTKIAMVVSASESSELVIRLPHFEIAFDFINKAEVNMSRVFAGAGRNELGPVSVKVADLLERVKTPIPEKEVFSFLFHDCRDQREMDAVIGQLVRTRKAIRYSIPVQTKSGPVSRAFLCSPAHLPEAVQRELARVDESSRDLTVADNPPPQPSSTPVGGPDLLQALRPDAPSSSAVGATDSPAELHEQKDQTSPQSVPSQKPQT